MKKFFKKAMASAVATTSLTVCMVGFNASASAYGTTTMGGNGTGYLYVSSSKLYAYTEGEAYKSKNVAIYAITGSPNDTSKSNVAYNLPKVTVEIYGSNMTGAHSDHEIGSSGTYSLYVVG